MGELSTAAMPAINFGLKSNSKGKLIAYFSRVVKNNSFEPGESLKLILYFTGPIAVGYTLQLSLSSGNWQASAHGLNRPAGRTTMPTVKLQQQLLEELFAHYVNPLRAAYLACEPHRWLALLSDSLVALYPHAELRRGEAAQIQAWLESHNLSFDL